MEKEREIQTTFRIPESMHRNLFRAARNQDRKVAQLFREWVRAYLANQEQKKQEA